MQRFSRGETSGIYKGYKKIPDLWAAGKVKESNGTVASKRMFSNLFLYLMNEAPVKNLPAVAGDVMRQDPRATAGVVG